LLILRRRSSFDDMMFKFYIIYNILFIRFHILWLDIALTMNWGCKIIIWCIRDTRVILIKFRVLSFYFGSIRYKQFLVKVMTIIEPISQIAMSLLLFEVYWRYYVRYKL
jgi:hypothetical protein